MTAKTTAERQEALRKRRAAGGLAEVRGIFAHADDHPAIKQAATKISGQRQQAEKRDAKAAFSLAQ